MIVYWSIACAIALYQLIRYMTGSKKHRKLLTNLMFIPFLILALLRMAFPPYRMGPGPVYHVSYVKEADGYYFFSNGTVTSVDKVHIPDEAKDNERVVVQILDGFERGNSEIVIDGKNYTVRNDINAVFPDYSGYYKFELFGSLAVLAVFDILTMIKNTIDYYKEGDGSSDENEEKEKS